MDPQPVRRACPERYRRLLVAAEAAFAERGFHRTSVKDITDRAGVATGTYYLYFPTKEASCLALIEDVYADLLGAVVRRRQGLPDVRAKLAASVVAAVETFARRPAAARVVFVQAPGAHPAFDRRLYEIEDELQALVAEDVAAAVAAGLLPPQPAGVSARCLVGALREALLAWVRQDRGRARAPGDPREQLPDLLAFILRGLGVVPPELDRVLASVLPPVGAGQA